MGFSRQEYWSRLPWPPPGDLPDPGIEPISYMYMYSQSSTELHKGSITICLESLDNLPRTCHQEQQGAVLLLLTATACCANPLWRPLPQLGALCSPSPTLCPAEVASPGSGRTLGRPAPSTEPTPHGGCGLPTHALTKSNPALLVVERDGAFWNPRVGLGLGCH